MQSLRMARAMGAADATSIWRDPLLRGMAVVPLGLAAGVRWALPLVLPRISGLVGLDLAPYMGLFFGYVLLLLPPAICGMVVGFLLLDQRDERTLRALSVTPLPLWGFLAYRLAAPIVLSFCITLVALPLAGVAPLDGLLLLAVVAAAPISPILALFLAAFAANKVQGFALQKLLGLVLVCPALAQFLPAPWPLVAALLPTYWPAALMWQATTDGERLALFAIGLVYQFALLALLLRRTVARLHQ